MEFSFDVNHVLPNEITLLRNKDIVIDPQKQYNARGNMNMQVKQNLSKIIDVMGAASSQAQKLRGAITSAFKLKSSDHHLYVLKDANSSGLGCVVGIIRVGYKRLFLIDIYGQQHECQPLCVLDFYVYESKQRSGFGKRLFQHMLDTENVQPYELAIDRPSPKFISFLAKQCSLLNPISQMNKFVVFESFFNDLSAVGGVETNRRRTAPGFRKHLAQHIRPESRNASSATVKRTGYFQQDRVLSMELSKYRTIPPINRNATNDNVKPTNSAQYVNSQESNQEKSAQFLPLRPPGSHGIRRSDMKSTSDSTIRNYSRHSVQQKTLSQSLPRTSAFSEPFIGRSSNYGYNVRTHTLINSPSQFDRNITSLDSPFSKDISKQDKRNVQVENEASPNETDNNYTVDNILKQMNVNKQTLGTSWNVFGVPPSSASSKNPYSRIQRRGFPT